MNEQDAVQFSLNGGEQISYDSPSSVGEKALFKGPKSQDLVRFRKSIEGNDFSAVRRFIDENPKYLVGCGDTPTILQVCLFTKNAVSFS